jgi:hypothetical protein
VLIVEYVGVGQSCWSSLDQDDVDEVVLTEAVSDETQKMLVRREKGFEGIVVGYRCKMFGLCVLYGETWMMD